jgi:GTP-binding protein
MPHPVVAIVGAPNVGKSTLFNRLLGRRQAIVADQPGVTRDRLMSDCELNGRSVTLVDTGGVVTGPKDDLGRRVRAEALKAIEAADVIVYVIDSRAGLTGSDEHVATLLRASGRPIIPVANKIDSRGQEGFQFEMYRLGLGDVVPVSAEQGRGIDDLTDAIVARLPQSAPVASMIGVPLAIIGRPNVGKSSLFNRIIREERSVVSEVPGTTRDPVDATFALGDTLYRILDTAGIRRRTAGAGEVEWVSVLKARQALESSEIVIALVDGVEGVQHQDRALLGLVTDSHKPSVLAVNKIDLLDPAGPSAEARAATIREELRFSRHVPAVPLSAKTGKGLGTLLKTLARVREQSLRRFPTTDLNRALKSVVAEKHPPADGGREVRFHYISQAPGAPPCFVVFGNGRRVDPSYHRYMEGRLRERLGLDLSPITLLFRRRKDSR